MFERVLFNQHPQYVERNGKKSFIKFIYGDKPTWTLFSLHRFLDLHLAQILAHVN